MMSEPSVVIAISYAYKLGGYKMKAASLTFFDIVISSFQTQFIPDNYTGLSKCWYNKGTLHCVTQPNVIVLKTSKIVGTLTACFMCSDVSLFMAHAVKSQSQKTL